MKNFLAQFGISANSKLRKNWKNVYIVDDPPRPDLKFQPGMLSFAGWEPNSRATEVFVVRPDTPRWQLDNFGVNPWETPFGFVEQEDLVVVDKFYSGYGEGLHVGTGVRRKAPDAHKIHEEDEKFPSLSYIGFCQITGSSRYQTKADGLYEL